MLKIELDKKNGKGVIAAGGDVLEITSDVCVVVDGIYSQLKNSSPIAAEAFRMGIMALCGDADSPVFTRTPDGVGFAIATPSEE